MKSSHLLYGFIHSNISLVIDVEYRHIKIKWWSIFLWFGFSRRICVNYVIRIPFDFNWLWIRFLPMGRLLSHQDFDQSSNWTRKIANVFRHAPSHPRPDINSSNNIIINHCGGMWFICVGVPYKIVEATIILVFVLNRTTCYTSIFSHVVYFILPRRMRFYIHNRIDKDGNKKTCLRLNDEKPMMEAPFPGRHLL